MSQGGLGIRQVHPHVHFVFSATRALRAFLIALFCFMQHETYVETKTAMYETKSPFLNRPLIQVDHRLYQYTHFT
jgi:hypothetical protein